MDNSYNVNVKPLLAQYNNTNQYNINTLIEQDELANIRGSGNFNPAPLYPQTTDNGNAYSNIKPDEKHLYSALEGNIEINTTGALQIENTWNSNINNNIVVNKNNPGKSDYKDMYDEYQVFAYNTTRKNDPYLLPYYFSKINIKFIQDNVVDIVKKHRNITIETKQDINGLLNMMVNNYLEAYESQGVTSHNLGTNISKNYSSSFQSILGNLNKITIEQYIKNIFSTLNMTEYYIKDISTLPMPMSRPTYIAPANKGVNELGFVGFFEDNQKFTNSLSSFNGRNILPGKINSTQFGN